MINPTDLKDNILIYKKLIIYAVIGLCVFAADFYFILKPVVGGLIKTIPNVNSKASRINIMDTDVKNIPNYENQIERLKEKLSGYKRRFSTKEEISPLLKNLSDTAKVCNVKIISINPLEDLEQTEVEAPGAYRKLPIFLRAVSEYHSFGLFLSKLENSDTFMRITDLEIIGDASGSNNHKFNVMIVTYILGTPEEDAPYAEGI